jgi:hypothetical protein
MKTKIMKRGMVEHSCNSSYLETEAGGSDYKFKASLTNTGKPCLKIKYKRAGNVIQ